MKKEIREISGVEERLRQDLRALSGLTLSLTPVVAVIAVFVTTLSSLLDLFLKALHGEGVDAVFRGALSHVIAVLAVAVVFSVLVTFLTFLGKRRD